MGERQPAGTRTSAGRDGEDGRRRRHRRVRQGDARAGRRWTSTPAGQRLARGAPVTVRPSAWRAVREPGGAAQAAEQLPEHS
ncbi:hypothetical protein B590_27659 [Streptomyces sp. PVA_94-07]|nr:hypothetical protein B590_27659 [Streptomyces sp. PVA_94-07]